MDNLAEFFLYAVLVGIPLVVFFVVKNKRSKSKSNGGSGVDAPKRENSK